MALTPIGNSNLGAKILGSDSKMKNEKISLDPEMVSKMVKEEVSFYGSDPKFVEMCHDYRTELSLIEMKMDIAAKEKQLKDLIRNCEKQQKEVRQEFTKMKRVLKNQMEELKCYQ